jgi:fatty acid desaturase/cytochrome b involved in lipid metabolism
MVTRRSRGGPSKEKAWKSREFFHALGDVLDDPDCPDPILSALTSFGTWLKTRLVLTMSFIRTGRAARSTKTTAPLRQSREFFHALGNVLDDPPPNAMLQVLTTVGKWVKLYPQSGATKSRVVEKVQEIRAVSKTPKPECDLWTIHGNQYDLTDFVHSHPGGVAAIELAKGVDGHDATQLFESYHPFTQRHRLVLAKYLYKAATEGAWEKESCFDEVNTPFWDDIRKVVRAYFSPKGNETDRQVQRNSKATNTAWVRHAIGMCMVSFAFAKWCYGSPAAIVYFPVLYWIVCSDLMHNGSHFAMSSNQWVNTICTYIGAFHVQYHLWAVQHVIGHHTHTNLDGRDPDLAHFTHADEDEKNVPGYRTARSHPYLPKYRLLWKFAVLFQCFATTIAIAFLNVPMYLSKRKLMTTAIPERFVKHIKLDRALVLLGCIIFCYFHGVARGVFTIFVSWCVHGALFNFFSQVSHINESSMVATEEYRARKKLEKNEWAVHQMLTACDYSCNSTFWAIMSINLNQQIMHHMFPSVHPCHYPALRDVIIPVAKSHGIDYEKRSSNTFRQAASEYVKWLYEMNEVPEFAASLIPKSTMFFMLGVAAILVSHGYLAWVLLV